MGLTGKYKFEGIQKASTLTLKGALAGSPITKFPFFTSISNLLTNFLANQGLVLANVAVYTVDGIFDEKAYNKAMNGGIAEVDSGKKLSPQDIKRIDDEVIKAARNAFRYGRKPTP